VLATAITLTLLSTLPPTGQPTRLQLDASGWLDALALQTSPPPLSPPAGDGLDGGGALAITAFARALADDGAAPPLQPFLQRVARFRLEGGGGAATIHWPANTLSASNPGGPFIRYTTNERHGQARAHADGYVGRWLYLAGTVGVAYSAWTPDAESAGTRIAHGVSSALRLESELAAGVRFGDALILAGWRVEPTRVGDASLSVRFWGGAFAGAELVLRRFVALDARVQVIADGALVDGAATVWLRRRFGLTAGAGGGHGGFADSTVTYDRAGGHVGVAWWLSPRLAASLAYALDWQRGRSVSSFGVAESDFSSVAHVVTLGVAFRPALGRR
jgi:hypothetical protein